MPRTRSPRRQGRRQESRSLHQRWGTGLRASLQIESARGRAPGTPDLRAPKEARSGATGRLRPRRDGVPGAMKPREAICRDALNHMVKTSLPLRLDSRRPAATLSICSYGLAVFKVALRLRSEGIARRVGRGYGLIAVRAHVRRVRCARSSLAPCQTGDAQPMRPCLVQRGPGPPAWLEGLAFVDAGLGRAAGVGDPDAASG